MDDLSRFSMMGLIPSGPHALCSSSSLISLSMPVVLISMGGICRGSLMSAENGVGECRVVRRLSESAG